ncbi:MAG TPA: hypothetical protein VMW24_17310 [Sedimentisphaerales bacterium]|nr:hypothetical protein [Sedimentisphaerales bacterium]
MKAILVRVGVDQAYGHWNAPAEPNYGRFLYVPIPESRSQHSECKSSYKQLLPSLEQFAEEYYLDLFSDLGFPKGIKNRATHLDPDFENLTYGDDGDKRGSQIRSMSRGDLVVFYAGLRPLCSAQSQLVYALIGLFKIDEIVMAKDVPREEWDENAHTRRDPCDSSDIVVRALPGHSGRLARCLAIGEFRDRAYRVRHEILDAWGGLSVKDGFIQRSARPPFFLNPDKFYGWFQRQNVPLIQENNPESESRVVLVHLRQPNRADPDEKRSDPFWEFGSFGCTGCHGRNLMNPSNAEALEGMRLAFAQGGYLGFRLVLLTPPVRVFSHQNHCEARWECTQKMPFRYDHAPLLIDNKGDSQFRSLKSFICSTNRSTWMAKFSSKFRSRRTPLPAAVGRTIIKTYSDYLKAACDGDFARTYSEALPYPPRTIDKHRKNSYQHFLDVATGQQGCPKCRRTRCAKVTRCYRAPK